MTESYVKELVRLQRELTEAQIIAHIDRYPSATTLQRVEKAAEKLEKFLLMGGK